MPKLGDSRGKRDRELKRRRKQAAKLAKKRLEQLALEMANELSQLDPATQRMCELGWTINSELSNNWRKRHGLKRWGETSNDAVVSAALATLLLATS